jgi:hypothetical protein
MLGAAWKRWNWLEDGLVPLSAVLMHAAWAFPLFALFMRNTVTGATTPGFTFGLCLAVLAGGVIAGKMASQNRMGVVIVAVGGLAAIWVALLLTVPADSQSLDLWLDDIAEHLRYGREGEAVPTPFVVGLCVAILWWRGVRIATAERSETVGSFVTGVVALTGLLFLAALLPSSSSQTPSSMAQSMSAMLGPMAFLTSLIAALGFAVLSRYLGERVMLLSQMSITVGLLFLALILPVGPSAEALGRWMLVFLGSGLVALALYSVLDTLRQQAEKTGIVLRIDRYWTATTLGLVAIVLVLGLLVGQIVAPSTIARTLGWLRPVWTALVQVLLLLIFVIAYLFFNLFEPLLARIQNRPQQPGPQPFESPLGLEDVEKLAREPMQIPTILGQILKVLLVLGVLALVVWLFVLAVRRRKRGTLVEDGVIETRETILSLDLVRSQLQGLLNGLRRQKPPPAFVEPGAPEDPRRAIRELYQKLLARGVALNLPRAKSQTPNTYQQTLGYLCTQEQDALETLTLAYEMARYGLLPPTREQVRAAREAFARIDAALQAAGPQGLTGQGMVLEP